MALVPSKDSGQAPNLVDWTRQGLVHETCVTGRAQ